MGLALPMLLLVLPVMLVVALLVKLTSPGPLFFRQQRVGIEGRNFTLIKFRTMSNGRSGATPKVTRAGDSRITTCGKALRRWKLDELPQLLNVLAGHMSFVGPRPDVPEYLQNLDEGLNQIFLLRPGLTGVATLQYRNEEELLGGIPEEQLEEFYRTRVLPHKIRLDLDYARRAGLLTDLGVLLRTVRAIL